MDSLQIRTAKKFELSVICSWVAVVTEGPKLEELRNEGSVDVSICPDAAKRIMKVQ